MLEVTKNNILTLKEAAEQFDIDDLATFRKRLKNIKCIISIAGIDFVDVDKLQAKALEKSQINSSSNRPKRIPSPVGLLKARIIKYPIWISDKITAIDSMRLTIASADNTYERSQSRKKLAKLQSDLDRMEGNFQNDQDKLNAILNADYETANDVESGEMNEVSEAVEVGNSAEEMELAESSNGTVN